MSVLIKLSVLWVGNPDLERAAVVREEAVRYP